jgi:molybdate transport system substrate-binding protein
MVQRRGSYIVSMLKATHSPVPKDTLVLPRVVKWTLWRIALLVTLLCVVSLQVQASTPVPAIAAASDLKFALDELVAAFKLKTGTTLRVSYGSSGNFFRQIVQEAPFELFMSADEDFVRQLAERKLTVDDGTLYAIGRLVLFTPKGSGVAVDTEFTDLRKALTQGRLKKFAIANPEHAPYGRAAKEALQTANLWDAMVPKLVLGENVSQAAQFAASGSTQGGIFAHSLALAPAFSEAGSFVLIPETMHKPLRQRMVLLRKATGPARDFYAYLQTPAARSVFKRYGFELPAVVLQPLPPQ